MYYRFVRYYGSMTVIGIISDTHGFLDRRIGIAFSDCSHIIHAGDIGGISVIDELEAIAPVTAVLGNNDFPEYGTCVERVAKPIIDGVPFLVSHYPRDVDFSHGALRSLVFGERIPQICIHGHTHIPRLDTGSCVRPADMLMCPGSATYPRYGFPKSIAKLEIRSFRVVRACIEDLDGNTILSYPDL